MYFLKRYPDFRTIFTVIRCYSIARKSHYDVLNLRRNCTDKEIKQAFIKMSKEYHPDINKDSKAQEQFIRVTEAYNTLSKPGSRAQYDRSQMDPGLYHPHVYRSYETYGYRKSTRSEQYTDSSRTQKNREGPAEQSYYGVKGLKKVPNVYIIILCFGIAFVGTFMQVFVIREMYVVQRQQSLQRSKLLAEELDRVRAAAKSNPNEVHTRLLLERIVGAANPTVATASMGQALATDKKIPPEHSDSRTPTADGDQDPSDLRESVVEPLLTEYGIQVVQTDELDLVYSATPKMKKAVTFMDLVRSFVNSYYRDP